MNDLRTRLFEMEWLVCEDGYEIIEEPKKTLDFLNATNANTPLDANDFLISPKSKNIKKYNPLKNNIDLVRRCSEITKSENPHQEMLNFANKFGLLGFNSFIENIEKPEPVIHWQNFIDSINLVYKFYDKKDIHGNLDRALTCYNGNQQWLLMRSAVKWNEKPSLRTLELNPANLGSLIWVLLSEELTSNLSLKQRQSPRCQQWFQYRANQKYCSVKCRVYGNRHIEKSALS